MKTILIDDEPASNTVLSNLLLQHCPQLKIAATCGSGPEGIEAIRKHRPELVFLDVEMEGMSGLDMLMQLQPADFEVIFVTAHDEYAKQAIRLSALDYLGKPPVKEEVMSAVFLAGQRHSQRQRLEAYELLFDNLLRRNAHQPISRIALPANHNAVEFVDLHTIVHVEADRAYSIFHLSDGRKIVVAKNIGEYEALLDDLNFMRTHRSHLVNLAQVRYYHKGDEQLELFNGVRLPVAKVEKENVVKRLGGM